MFKRPARILFVEIAPAIRARMAETAGTRFGSGWLEARAASLTPSADGFDSPCEDVGPVDAACAPLTAGALDWADLVITLDPISERGCPPLPPGTRRKHWALVGAEAEAGGEIEAQIKSMIGGLRMLARADAAGARGDQDADD